MDNPRPEKVAVVAEVREKMDAAQATLLTEYRGIDVAGLAELRRSLRDAGGEYKVYKNTLVRFAARDLGHEIDDLLTGPTALAFVDGDAAAVAKALRDYARNNDKLIIKGGVLGTKLLSANDVKALAELPSRDVVLAQFAGALQAPMQQMAGLMAAVMRNLAYGIKALVEQQGGVPVEEPAAEEPAAEEPAEEAPAAEEPAEEEPAEEAPADEAPADEAPADEAAAEAPEAEATETPAESEDTESEDPEPEDTQSEDKA